MSELNRQLTNLAGWFRLQVGGTLTPEGKQNCAFVCEEAAKELNTLREAIRNLQANNKLRLQEIEKLHERIRALKARLTKMQQNAERKNNETRTRSPVLD